MYHGSECFILEAIVLMLDDLWLSFVILTTWLVIPQFLAIDPSVIGDERFMAIVDAIVVSVLMFIFTNWSTVIPFQAVTLAISSIFTPQVPSPKHPLPSVSPQASSPSPFLSASLLPPST